ncbi:hypothetical protein EV643_13351 [Kribbella sp. VKM Ac-2527]|uniref:Fibronectin type-III domain-containing protein n=1 Tax=Kribbella caucasensis TaxID=2512215 RepID=A0A4R6JBV3_9ACTN|nr:hypothetical protein [Kribbella sp. VKM Ac-2527]TDO33253.1 hypothetical protein EV643_13351 [Kribbella sp. VKM Ac-2527]
MRRLMTGLAVAAVSTIGLTIPAHAADPAPTGVTVAWADAAHTRVRVTWNETGDLPNLVRAEYSDGQGAWSSVAAGAANQVDFTSSDVGARAVVRMAVYAGTTTTGPTSGAGFSVPFDALRGGKPVIDQITPVPPTRFTIRWHPAAAQTDPNPGDPLDLPPAAPQYRVIANYNIVNIYDWVTPLSSATQVTFEQWSAPAFKVAVANFNEWGAIYSNALRVDYERFGTLTIPAAANYGQPTVIKGQIQRWSQLCDPGPCWSEWLGETPRLVVLHARANASSPWYVVGTTKSAADGRFTLAPTTLGTRQYRVAVPDVFEPAVGLGIGIISGAVTTLAKPRAAASFADPTVAYGQRVTARVSIAPPATVRTTLQRWDGTAWRDLKWVYTSNGAGSYTFTSTQRGRFAYRFLVPSFTYAGRPLSWQVSPNIVLTTS